jgi:hypothetical protein
VRRALVLAATLLAVTACQNDDSDPGPDAGDRLTEQRDGARDAMAVLMRELGRDLGGTVSDATGNFEGCASDFTDDTTSFRYLARTKVEAGAGAPARLVDAAPAALESAGFGSVEEGEVPEGTAVTGTDGPLTGSVTERPGIGAWVIVDVAGECVEVPEDERDDWLARDADTIPAP